MIKNQYVINVTNKMVIEYRVRDWCKLPYDGHKKGCPNYGKRKDCPPNVGLIEDEFDLSKPHYFAIVEFDLGAHMNKMKERHPHWTIKQQRNVLYWQGTVRKKLRLLSEEFIKDKGGLVISTCPEAMGVNVFKTFPKIGKKMVKSYNGIVYKVALIAHKK